MHLVCPSCLTVNRVPPERFPKSPACGRRRALVRAVPAQRLVRWLDRSLVGSARGEAS